MLINNFGNGIRILIIFNLFIQSLRLPPSRNGSPASARTNRAKSRFQETALYIPCYPYFLLFASLFRLYLSSCPYLIIEDTIAVPTIGLLYAAASTVLPNKNNKLINNTKIYFSSFYSSFQVFLRWKLRNGMTVQNALKFLLIIKQEIS